MIRQDENAACRGCGDGPVLGSAGQHTAGAEGGGVGGAQPGHRHQGGRARGDIHGGHRLQVCQGIDNGHHTVFRENIL